MNVDSDIVAVSLYLASNLIVSCGCFFGWFYFRRGSRNSRADNTDIWKSAEVGNKTSRESPCQQGLQLVTFGLTKGLDNNLR
jgi:hypothetical protein